MMNLSPYFIENDDNYLCKKPLTIVRIPFTFFEKGLAEFVLKEVDCLGIFYINFYDVVDFDENAKPDRRLLSLPMTFRMCPSDIIEKTIDGKKFYEFIFHERDVFMKHRSLVKHVTNVEKVFELLFNNFMPESIDYTGEFNLLRDCKNINSIDLKASEQVLAMIVAECNRNPDNINEPFRFALNRNPKLSQLTRHVVRIVDIGRINDSFMGLGSGHPSRAVTVAITKHRLKNSNQLEQPVLKAIK